MREQAPRLLRQFQDVELERVMTFYKDCKWTELGEMRMTEWVERDTFACPLLGAFNTTVLTY